MGLGWLTLTTKVQAALGSAQAKGRLTRLEVYGPLRRGGDYQLGLIDPAKPTLRDMHEYLCEQGLDAFFPEDHEWEATLSPDQQEQIIQTMTEAQMRILYPLPYA